mgnify:CR=1 FL=1
MAQILGFFSVSPAPAGMIPLQVFRLKVWYCEPRTRGDDPGQAGKE